MVLQSILGLCCNKTYGAMTNNDDRDYYGDGNINQDGNNDNNAALIRIRCSDLIMMPRSSGRGLADNSDVAAAAVHYIYMCCTIYLPYKDPIKDFPQG